VVEFLLFLFIFKSTKHDIFFVICEFGIKNISLTFDVLEHFLNIFINFNSLLLKNFDV